MNKVKLIFQVIWQFISHPIKTTKRAIWLIRRPVMPKGLDWNGEIDHILSVREDVTPGMAKKWKRCFRYITKSGGKAQPPPQHIQRDLRDLYKIRGEFK